MENKELYAVIITNDDNFGIDAKVSLFRKLSDAKQKLFNEMIYIMTDTKIKTQEYGENEFTFFDENNNQYTGIIEKFFYGDKPQLDRGEYPITMSSLIHCFAKHNAANTLINAVMIEETMFKRQDQIKNLEEYIKETEKALIYAKSALNTIEQVNNIAWLSITETGNEMDYAMFHNKYMAQSYLSCQFEQAMRKIGLINDNNITSEDKAKYYKHKEQFALNNKMKYEIDANDFKCYGKIVCIEIDKKEE